jgi:hypothetical protein
MLPNQTPLVHCRLSFLSPRARTTGVVTVGQEKK